LAISISNGSGVSVVLGSLFTLFPSVGSFAFLVLDSLDGVFKGGFGEFDLVFNAGKLDLAVSKGGLGDTDGDIKKSAGLVVGGNTGVFSVSLKVEGVLDLLKELINEINDPAEGTLVSELLGL